MIETTVKCETCRDTGWKTVAGDKGPRAIRCDCQQRLRNERLLKHASIPERYKHCELSNFEHEGPFQSLAPAHLMASQFVQNFPVDRVGLLLVGKVGRGKTHLAVGILQNLMLSKGVQCLFCDYRELLKDIQNSYNPTVSATELQVLRPVFEAEVLLLDELGAVKPTEWVWDTVSHVLNTRYNDHRTTIITTNYRDLPPRGDMEEPLRTSARNTAEERAALDAAREPTLGDRIGERMRSRLHEMCRIVVVNGDADFRIKWKKGDWQ